MIKACSCSLVYKCKLLAVGKEKKKINLVIVIWAGK